MDTEHKIQSALSVACACVPYLSGLAAAAEILVDDRIRTAGVFPSGKMLISPGFVENLNVKNLAFVLAHELMHLSLKTHERQGDCLDAHLVNIAHDFIINEMLGEPFLDNEFSEHDFYRPPMGGLVWADTKDEFEKKLPDQKWKPAVEFSLEEMVLLLGRFPKKYARGWQKAREKKKRVVSAEPAPHHAPTLGDLLSESGIRTNSEEETPPQTTEPPPTQDDAKDTSPFPDSDGDVLSEKAELQMFPEQTVKEVRQKEQVVHEAVVRSYAEREMKAGVEALLETFRVPQKQESGSDSYSYQLLRGAYRTPWEAALQRWFDSVQPGQRSWARPSRRGAFRTDLVLPGRERTGWTLHIVLDTSGSMDDELSAALGAIDQFCQGAGVESVHILQCDTDVTVDEYVELGDLEHFKAEGFGGSDMTPAMLRLAEDPDVDSVIVLTDGWIGFPKEPMPYETLWCIVSGYQPDFSYGTVIQIHG